MSNVINFLEKIGQDAQLRHASRSEIELALAHTQIDQEICGAIVGRDGIQLENLMGVSLVACMQFFDDSDERENENNLEKCA